MPKFELLENRLKKQKDKLPPSLYTIDKWEEVITSFTVNYKIPVQILAVEILQPLIDGKNEEIYACFGYIPYRFELEHKNYIKSWHSILDKVLRYIEKGEIIKTKDPIKFISYYLRKMEDIARCRILCNYNNDMVEIDKLFQSTEFKNELKTCNFCYKNRKDKRLESVGKLEKTTHRAIQHYFEIEIYKNRYIIEVQLMTFLQEVWDSKQHIIYEMLRGGEKDVDLEKINQRYAALSVLLMIADEFADENQKKYLKWIREQR